MARPQEPRPALDFAAVTVRDGRVCVTPSDLRCIESFRCWELGQRVWFERHVPGARLVDSPPAPMGERTFPPQPAPVRPSGQGVIPIVPGYMIPQPPDEESICLALYERWRRGRDQWELMAASIADGTMSPFESRPSGQIPPPVGQYTAAPRPTVPSDLETFQCVERGRALATWVEANDRDRAGMRSPPAILEPHPAPVGPRTGMDWSEGYSIMQEPQTYTPKFPTYQPGGQAGTPPAAPTDSGLPEWAKYLIGGVVGAGLGYGVFTLTSERPRANRRR